MKKRNSESAPIDSAKNTFTYNDYVAISIFLLYLLVDFLPTLSSYTFADTQWLYLNILNFGVAFYLYFSKISIENAILKNFIFSKTVFFYTIFIFLSGISIVGALNIDEGFITILRYLVSFSSLFLLFILFYDKKHTFLILASIVSVLIFVECWNALGVFFDNFGNMPIDQMRAIVTHHHDNKNIFAANILLKIPFVLFCITKTSHWKQAFFLLIFFTSCFLLLFLGSRSILAGLVLQIVLITAGFIVLVLFKKLKFKLTSAIIPLLFTVVSFVFYTIVTNYSEKRVQTQNTTAVAQSSTASDNSTVHNTVNLSQSSLDIRKKYWNSAVTSIANKPILGCGLGNWKIETLQYEQKWKPNNTNGVHVHNDFLQVAAETGVLNGVVFILIFGFLFYYNFKTIQKSVDKDQIIFALLLIAILAGLTVDSFFNFPLNRPTIQIIFMLLIVFTMINQVQPDNKNILYHATSWSKNTLFCVLMISFASLYPNYLIYNFFKAINITKQDNVLLSLRFNEVNALFNNFPSIDETGTPVNDIKIPYLIKENKFNLAAKLIDDSYRLNPYSVYANSLRVDLFSKKNQLDSAVFYAKKVYDLQPNYQVFYQRYIQILAKLKDSESIVKAFNNLDSNALNSQHFTFTFACLLKSGYNKTKCYDYIKRGLILFPTNPELLNIQKDFSESDQKKKVMFSEKQLQLEASRTNNYSKIESFYLKIYNEDKTNYAAVENLGICYFQQKKYTKAIKYLKEVVAANAFQNGKAEYVIAISYSNLNDKTMICDYAKKALAKNYNDAQILIQSNCQ